MKTFIQRTRENQYLTTFLNFYKSAETDITSIAVAYYFLISIFPLLLIVLNILPYFNIEPNDLLQALQGVLPDSLYDVITKMVRDILTRPSTGLLSLSILSALWAFSQSMIFLQKAFNKTYGIKEGRSMIWSRIVGILISLALQLLLSISLVLTMFGRMIITGLYHFLRFDQSLYEQLQTMTDPTVYLMLFLSLMMLYFLLPKVVIPKIRYVLPGSIFVVLILFGLINIFGASIDSYMRRFLDVRFAGSIVLILIMVWFILIAKVLIIGSILNATYQHCSEKSSEGFKNKEHRNKVTARLNN